MASPFRLPKIYFGVLPIWRRNLLVWRQIAIVSMMANFGEPFFYLLALGYGLGAFLPSIAGMTYINFLAGGMLAFSAMNTATMESLYSVFTRMDHQKTWDAILHTPLSLDDILISELIWSATKALFSIAAMIVVIILLDVSRNFMLLFLFPFLFLAALTFAALALNMTMIAKSYDFFLYYFTLVTTPMALVGGVFFPMERLPAFLQYFATILPLTHVVMVSRAIVNGVWLKDWWMHSLVLVLYLLVGFYSALVLARKRFEA
jgi:lipooligosaccharide transport system permease protein